MSKNYIGFSNSDKFLEAIDRDMPVNLSVTRQHGRSDKFGLSIDSVVLDMSQAGDRETLYFETVVLRFQSLNGKPFNEHGKEGWPARIAERVESLVKSYLEEHGVIVRDALLSMPKSYTKLNGEATFMCFDKDEDNYVPGKDEVAHE